MSIHFTSFNVFLRKITRFSYKEIAEEGKKETNFTERAVKKRPVLLKENFVKTGLIYGIFIKFAHCIGSKPGGLKKWLFWDYWEIVDFFVIKKLKALDFTRAFGYRHNIAK